ncbi:MAG: phage tail tape measure protein [Prevotella sp.]
MARQIFTTVVELTTEQAEQKLEELKAKAEGLKTSLAKAQNEGNFSLAKSLEKDLKKATAEVRNWKSQILGAKGVLDDINSASIKQLQKAMRQLNAQRMRFLPSSDEFNEAEEGIKKIQTRIDELRIKQEKSVSTIDRYEEATSKAVKSAETLQRENEMIARTIKNISSANMLDINFALRMVNEQLENTERNTGAYDELKKKAKLLRQEISKLNNEQRQQTSLAGRVADGFNRIQGMVTFAVATFAGVSMTVRRCIAAFTDMDTAMNNVRKYTGQTLEEVKAMNEEFKALDTRTAREQLNELAGAAGRLGITSKDGIMEFVDAADKINVALGDDLGEGAVDKIGKLAMAFGEDEKMGLRGAMLATGSAINELAQNSSANAGYLVEFAARLAGVGQQAGLTQAQIIGIGAAMDENMQKDEMAATALSQIITKMVTDTDKFAKMCGANVKEFSNLVKTDMNAAILQFFEAMNKKGGFAQLAPMFQDLGMDGQRATSVLSILATKIDDVRQRQELATKAYKEGTSVIDEFNVQNETVQAKLDKAKKRLNDMAVELGERLIPATSLLITTFGSLVRILSVVVKWSSENISVIAGLTAAIVALTLAEKGHVAVTKLMFVWNNLVVGSFKSLFKLVTRHPYVAVAAAAMSLIGVIANLITKNKELSATQNTLNSVNEEASRTVAKEMARYKQLRKTVEDSNRSYESRKEALDELKKMVPEYHGELTTENTLINSNTEALDNYTSGLLKAAKARAAFNKMVAIEEGSLNSEQLIRQKRGNKQYLLNKIRTMGLEGWDYYDLDSRKGQVTMVNDQGDKKTISHEKYQEYAKLKQYLEMDNKIIEQEEKKLDVYKQQTEQLQKIADESKQTVEVKSETKTEDATYKTQAQLKAEEKARKAAEREEAKAERERLKALRDANNKEKAETERMLAENYDSYAKGNIDYRTFVEQRNRIQKDGIERRMALYDEESDEYKNLMNDMAELTQGMERTLQRMSIDDVERRHNAVIAEIQAQFYNVNSEMYQNEAMMNEEMYMADMDYMLEKKDLYAKGTEEWLDIVSQIELMEMQHQLEQARRYDEMRMAYSEEYARKGAEKRLEIELAALDELHAKGLLSEKEYLQARLALQAQYSTEGKSKADKIGTDASNMLKVASDKATTTVANDTSKTNDLPILNDIAVYKETMTQLKQMYGTDEQNHAAYLEAKRMATAQFLEGMVAKFQVAYSSINNVMSAAANYYSACSDYEVAVSNKKYDAMIEKAEGNTAKQKKLEEKKQKEEAKIKAKYNKRAMKIQIAQAIASTAMAAINAYSSAAQVPLIGYILAPIAAAMAVAAGMIQIATIKKQQAAQEVGYYSGGYTGGSNYRKQAGVVHEGEFVANHDTVNNPNLVPFLNFIDMAQRNNRSANISQEDVTRQLGNGGTAIVAPVVSVTTDNGQLDATVGQLNEAIGCLNAILASGIHANVSIDGQDGVAHQLDRYNKLHR